MPLIHNNIPAAEYHAITGRLSASGIQPILRSPAHYQAWLADHDAGPAALLGTMVHCLWTEVDQFDNRFAIEPKYDARTKEGKVIRDAFRSECAAGLIPVECEGKYGYPVAKQMISSLDSHRGASSVLAAAREVEITILWEHRGCPMKSRLDLFTKSRIVVDLKTINCADDEHIQRVLMDRYGAQAATYLAASEAAGMDPSGFLFVFVENCPPFGVRLVVPSMEVIQFGRTQLDAAAERFRDCTEAGTWPAYPDEISTIGLPRWKSRQLEYEE